MIKRCVYFIEAGDGGPIKIGVATDIAQRLREVQCGNHLELRLIIALAGDFEDERRLHRRFQAERIRGEWFRGDGVLRAFVIALVDAGAAAKLPPPEPKRTRKSYIKAGRPWERRRYTDEEWRALFHVGDGGSIYRSELAEAERAAFEAQWVSAPALRKGGRR